ncbi:hypothetical protein FB451DRAFT_1165200 [Mycena latifolia]|nr:hypothetical protein FB451DRAFT_1165200 [Mycena latifolia]
MNINDPEYAPIYYKMMVLDQSGTAENGPSGNSGNELKCYGCLGDGHRIFECRQIADLVQKNIIVFNDETRRLTMKNGTQIRRMPGESLVKAAERIANSNVPHAENRRAHIVECREFQGPQPESGAETRGIGRGVRADPPHVPSHDAGKKPIRKDEMDSMKELPDIIPVEARQVRFEKEDVEMTENRSKEKAGKKKSLEKKMEAEEGKMLKKEEVPIKPIGRQSELSATVNKSDVMDRILDTEVKLTLRELEEHAFGKQIWTSERCVGEMSEFQIGNLKGQNKIGNASSTERDVGIEIHSSKVLTRKFREGIKLAKMYVVQIFLVIWTMWEIIAHTGEKFWKSLSQRKAQYKEMGRQIPSSCRPSITRIPTMSANLAEHEFTMSFPLPPDHQDEAAALRQMLSTDADASIPIDANTTRPPIQYLSRREYHRPYSPTNPIHTADPAHAIDNAVIAEWEKYERNEELEPYPSFAAAPHSVYYGKSILPDGQVAHYHVSLNVLRLLKNRDTKLPFSVAGHEYTVTLQAPPAGVTWAREAWYPTDDALHKEMVRMSPIDPPDEGDIGFPVHATTKALSLPTRLERERARSVSNSFSLIQNGVNLAAHLQLSQGPIVINHYRFEDMVPKEHSDSDSSVYLPAEGSDDISAESPDTVSSSPTTATTSTGPTSTEAATAVDELAQDIEKRACKVLSFDDDSDYDAMLELVPAEFEEESCTDPYDKGFRNDTGICAVCLGPRHALADCPQLGGASLANQDAPAGGLNNNNTFKVLRTYPDDVIVPRALIAASPIFGQSDALQRFVHNASATALEAFLLLPASDAVRIAELVQLGGEVRQALDKLQTRLARRIFAARPEGAVALVREITMALLGEMESGKSADTATSAPILAESVLTSHADRFTAPPRFRHRRVISRDAWSSSSVSSNDNSDDDFEEIEPYAPSQRPVTRFTNRSSPAVTEWSVTNSDFGVDPRIIIDAALSRITTRSSEHGTPPPSTHHADSSVELSSDSSSRTSDFLRAVSENTGHEPLFQFQDSTTDEQRVALDDWLLRGHAHQDEHTTTEDDVCGAPFRHVLYVLHEDLHSYLDSSAMATDGWDRLEVLSSLSMGINIRARMGATPADSTMSSASHDPPIPTPPVSPTLGPLMMTDDGQLYQGLANSGPSSEIPNEEVQNGKRKHPSDERVGEFQEEPRKKFLVHRAGYQATGLMDPDNIRLLAGIRMAILEGSQRLEGLVWHKYDVEEQHYPTEYLRHPLLFDVETAKLQVMYNVLYQNHRYELATLLHEVLTIHFKNEYAISHLLNAQFLEQQHPSEHTRYWELLPPPPSAQNDSNNDDDPSSDSDEDRYFYPDYEFRRTGDNDDNISVASEDDATTSQVVPSAMSAVIATPVDLPAESGQIIANLERAGTVALATRIVPLRPRPELDKMELELCSKVFLAKLMYVMKKNEAVYDMKKITRP